MSIWVIAPVTDEPEAVLTLWCIFETDKDTRHFVGYDGRSGRVSSFIVEFDPKTRKGTTASGRVYQLRGPSHGNSDADYVWQRWCAACGVETYEDVSEQMIPGCKSEEGPPDVQGKDLPPSVALGIEPKEFDY